MSQQNRISLGHRVDDFDLETFAGSAMPETTMTFENLPDPAPAMTVQIVFADGDVWTATQDGPTFSWTATQAEVDAHPDASDVRLVVNGVVVGVGQVIQRG